MNNIENHNLASIVPKEYMLEKEEHIKCIGSDAMILRHKKSGARIAVFVNEDENKLFSAAFKTPPIDNCGTPHIIEHSVLCGSEKYPVKDPFMQLVKSSMQTFLNAMTYADKTVYPVASCNDVDFINLSNVYLDAVFAPNIIKHKEIFMQEGWHYEPDENGGLNVGGVVYSEMLGALSSPDSNVYDGLISALFEGSPYDKNSGGDPEYIPNLTYEMFLDFYKTHYHPSNCYITLYGNMDHRERLEYIDREYLSKYDVKEFDFEIKYSERKNSATIKRVENKYALMPDESPDGKTFFAFGAECCDASNVVECMAYDFLSDILVESPGATVKNALISAGIGDEVYGGFLNHMKKPAFSVIAKNASSDDENKFLNIVCDTLTSIAENGINKKSLLAAIERSEFRFREGEQGSTPRGLNVNLSMLQNWIYSDDNPFGYLKVDEILSELRRLADTDYYETLIRRMLESCSKALFVYLPEPGLNERKAEELKNKLNEYRASITDTEYVKICDEYNSYTAYQEREETEDELSCIPLLSISDISPETQPVSFKEITIGASPAIIHELKTNGIIYARVLFDISHIPNEKLPYLDILSASLGKINTLTHSYADLLDEIRMNTGGFGFACEMYRVKNPKGTFVPVYEVNLRVLENKLSRALELLKEIIFETDLNDKNRLREIISEMLSEKQRDIVSSGSEYASSRALAYFSAADASADYLDGISSYMIQKELMQDYIMNSDMISNELKELVDDIFTKSACRISIAADSDIVDKAKTLISEFIDSLPEREIPAPASREPLGMLNEGFLTTSKVQYVAIGSNLNTLGYEYDGRYQILASVLNNDYLYPEIRMKGGAYGYSCAFSAISGNVSMVTYRDPCLSESLEVFKRSHDFIRNCDLDDEELSKHIIGTFGRIDRPMSAYMKSSRGILMWMSGRTYEEMQRDRSLMLNVTVDELKSLATAVESALDTATFCVIGNETKISDNSALFGKLVKLV